MANHCYRTVVLDNYLDSQIVKRAETGKNSISKTLKDIISIYMGIDDENERLLKLSANVYRMEPGDLLNSILKNFFSTNLQQKENIL